MKWSLLCVLLVLMAIAMPAALGASDTAVTQRPIEEWLAAQSSSPLCYCPLGQCCFVPAWTGDDPGHEQGWERWAKVDYAGAINAWLVAQGAPSLGTTSEGTVTERPLADGRAQIEVVLRTKNALCWVSEGSTGSVLFGSTGLGVLAGEPATLGECTLREVFINPCPGYPLPNLVQLAVAPEEGQEEVSCHILAMASGPLHEAFGVPEGTPGLLTVAELLPPSAGQGTTLADAWPVEVVKLQVCGNGH